MYIHTETHTHIHRHTHTGTYTHPVNLSGPPHPNLRPRLRTRPPPPVPGLTLLILPGVRRLGHAPTLPRGPLEVRTPTTLWLRVDTHPGRPLTPSPSPTDPPPDLPRPRWDLRRSGRETTIEVSFPGVGMGSKVSSKIFTRRTNKQDMVQGRLKCDLGLKSEFCEGSERTPHPRPGPTDGSTPTVPPALPSQVLTLSSGPSRDTSLGSDAPPLRHDTPSSLRSCQDRAVPGSLPYLQVRDRPERGSLPSHLCVPMSVSPDLVQTLRCPCPSRP